jgi:hypothetical protein
LGAASPAVAESAQVNIAANTANFVRSVAITLIYNTDSAPSSQA